MTMMLPIKAGASSSIYGRDSLNRLLSIRSSNQIEEADRFNIISKFYLFDDSIFQDSFIYWNQKAFALSQQLNYPKGRADAYYYLGTLYLSLKDEQASAVQYKNALEIYSQIKDYNGIARCFMQLSVIQINYRNFKESLDCIERSIEIAEQNKIPVNGIYFYLKGFNLFFLGRTEEAIKVLEMSLSLISKTQRSNLLNDNRRLLALALKKNGKNKEALELLTLSRNYAIVINTFERLRTQDYYDGQFYFLEGNYSKAEPLLLNALNNKVQMYVLSAIDTLAKLYFKTGRTELAIEYLNKHIRIVDSINMYSYFNQVAILKNRGAIIKQENEIELLEQKRKNERNINYALTAVSLLILLTAIISYKRYTFKRTANRKLSKANEELMQTLEDLQLTEQQLLQAEKMASLGRVTAGIAHELRNPLNFIQNFAAIADDSVKGFLEADPEEQKELAADIQTSIEKIRMHGTKAEEIITTMLRHGKEKVLDMKDVSLHELIDESITIASKNFGLKHEGFHCKVELINPQEDVRIKVNPKSIPLVIGNLIDNAMYSVMQKSKKSGKDFHPEINISHTLVDKGLLLEIKDNGMGLKKDNENEIFEPFFTTKPTGHGTGLGLSICYEILKAHGASISVHNNDNGGATFSIIFPHALLIESMKLN